MSFESKISSFPLYTYTYVSQPDNETELNHFEFLITRNLHILLFLPGAPRTNVPR